MSRDSAARPHELLKLRIKDVVFKIIPNKKQFAEILVIGKTGTKHIPLIDSIPYIKDWISQHPQGSNPSSILLCGFRKSLNRIIGIGSLYRIYKNYKDNHFPKLLDDRRMVCSQSGSTSLYLAARESNSSHLHYNRSYWPYTYYPYAR